MDRFPIGRHAVLFANGMELLAVLCCDLSSARIRAIVRKDALDPLARQRFTGNGLTVARPPLVLGIARDPGPYRVQVDVRGQCRHALGRLHF